MTSSRMPASPAMIRRSSLVIAIATLLVLAFSGTATMVFAEEPAQEITVKGGDTLNELCKQYLEDPARCKEIAAYNKLKDPNRIEPGARLLIPFSYLRKKPYQPVFGTVTYVTGDVASQEKVGTPWVPLELAHEVREGSRVRAGAASSAEIAFEDRSTLLLRPNTILDITSLQKNETGYLKRLFLSVGRIVSKAAKLSGMTSPVEVTTVTAVAGTRGTEFAMSMLEDQTVLTEVLEGAIAVSAMGQEVEVPAGSGTVVKKGLPPEQPRRLLPPPQPEIKPVITRMPLEARFTRIEGVRQYRVSLARDREGRDIVAEKVIAPDDAFQATGLDDGDYFLQMRSIDDAGLEGPEHEPALVQIRIEQQPPVVPPVKEEVMPEYGTSDRIMGMLLVISLFLF